MSSFTFEKLNLPGLILIEAKSYLDQRGFFLEQYKRSVFKEQGIKADFVQDNHSYSQKQVLRGVHYQAEPFAQGKLVMVIKGKIWDVAVDLRRDSSTFKKWVGVELSSENHKMLYLPTGFGHGFVSLEDDTHVYYKCTAEYSTSAERGIIWNDQTLDIKWPVERPIISEKDLALPVFTKEIDLF